MCTRLSKYNWNRCVCKSSKNVPLPSHVVYSYNYHLPSVAASHSLAYPSSIHNQTPGEHLSYSPVRHITLTCPTGAFQRVVVPFSMRKTGVADGMLRFSWRVNEIGLLSTTRFNLIVSPSFPVGGVRVVTSSPGNHSKSSWNKFSVRNSRSWI